MKMRMARRRSARGFSLIELSIAMVVLAVGLLATATLIYTAVVVNARSKNDSTATMLNQAIVEQISAVLVGSGSGTLSDCVNPTLSIDTEVGGARLNSAGVVDFSETAPPDGYHVDYVVCSGTGQQQVYDVRWNVQAVSPAIYMLTVGTRAQGRKDLLPANLRVYVSDTLWEQSH